MVIKIELNEIKQVQGIIYAELNKTIDKLHKTTEERMKVELIKDSSSHLDITWFDINNNFLKDTLEEAFLRGKGEAFETMLRQFHFKWTSNTPVKDIYNYIFKERSDAFFERVKQTEDSDISKPHFYKGVAEGFDKVIEIIEAAVIDK